VPGAILTVSDMLYGDRTSTLTETFTSLLAAAVIIPATGLTSLKFTPISDREVVVGRESDYSSDQLNPVEVRTIYRKPGVDASPPTSRSWPAGGSVRKITAHVPSGQPRANAAMRSRDGKVLTNPRRSASTSRGRGDVVATGSYLKS